MDRIPSKHKRDPTAFLTHRLKHSTSHCNQKWPPTFPFKVRIPPLQTTYTPSILISVTDYLSIRTLAFEWATSLDTKDWARLARCLAPTIVRLDFRSLRGPLHERLSRAEFVAMLSDAKLLGNKRINSHHLLGEAKLERLGEDAFRVCYQIRVAQQLYTEEDLAVVAKKGCAHGLVEHWYRRIEGRWMLEGVAADIQWTEGDFFGTFEL